MVFDLGWAQNRAQFFLEIEFLWSFPGTIEAEKFVLEDQSGRTRAELAMEGRN
jgi:hypothetical protein